MPNKNKMAYTLHNESATKTKLIFMNEVLKGMIEGYIKEVVTPSRFMVDELKGHLITLILSNKKLETPLIINGYLYENFESCTGGNIKYIIETPTMGGNANASFYFSLFDIECIKYHLSKTSQPINSNYGTIAVIKINLSKFSEK